MHQCCVPGRTVAAPQPNDYIDYDCLHDNGVERPVKRDANGNPITLTFGLTTDDEMCVLTGAYYSD